MKTSAARKARRRRIVRKPRRVAVAKLAMAACAIAAASVALERPTSLILPQKSALLRPAKLHLPAPAIVRVSSLRDLDLSALPGTTPVIAGGRYFANAVNLDGSNDYLTRAADLTGNADGKAGLVSFWLDLTAGDASTRAIWSTRDGSASSNEGLNVFLANTDKLFVRGRNTAGTTILQLVSTTSIVAASGWVHVVVSWNLATSSAWMYLNGVSDLSGSPTLTDDTIDYTKSDHEVGAQNDATPGSAKIAANVADLYVNYATHLDLSVQANREKFRSAAGKPVYLGNNGNLPTGSAPIALFTGPTDSWHVNKGTGEGFTEVGALTTASSSPST